MSADTMLYNGFKDTLSRLPVASVLDDLEAALNRHRAAVLVAPPGAGKTTAVPLALRQTHSAVGAAPSGGPGQVAPDESLTLRQVFDGGKDIRIDMLDDASVAFGGGMQPIRLIDVKRSVTVAACRNHMLRMRFSGVRKLFGEPLQPPSELPP